MGRLPRHRSVTRARHSAGSGAWPHTGRTVLAWLVATAMAAVAVWVGLQPVLAAAIPGDAIPLSAAQVRAAAAGTPRPLPPAPGGQPDAPGPSASPSKAGGQGGAEAPDIGGWLVNAVDGVPTYQRSFAVAGGTAVIRVTPGQVNLVSATPAPAYSVQTIQDSPDRLVVAFVNGTTVDYVDTVWWQDAPYAQISHLD